MVKVEEARQVLRNAGYYVDNLWSIHDVDTEGVDMTDDQKYEILDKVLQGEYIMEKINVSIGDEVEEFLIGKVMEVLYYSLHNFNSEYKDYETIRLWQVNKEGKFVIVSELERDLDNNFSVLDELNFHVEDWEKETTYIFEER